MSVETCLYVHLSSSLYFLHCFFFLWSKLEPEINLNTLTTIYNTIYSSIMVVRLHRTDPYRLMIHGSTFLSNVA